MKMRNACKDCEYYHKENKTCQLKKCSTGSYGYVSLSDRLFCSPCINPSTKKTRALGERKENILS